MSIKNGCSRVIVGVASERTPSPYPYPRESGGAWVARPSMSARRLDWSWLFSLIINLSRAYRGVPCISAPEIGGNCPRFGALVPFPTPLPRETGGAWVAHFLVWAPGASIRAEHFHYYQFILGIEGWRKSGSIGSLAPPWKELGSRPANWPCFFFSKNDHCWIYLEEYWFSKWIPADFMSVVMTSFLNRFLNYDVINSAIITEIQLLWWT